MSDWEDDDRNGSVAQPAPKQIRQNDVDDWDDGPQTVCISFILILGSFGYKLKCNCNVSGKKSFCRSSHSSSNSTNSDDTMIDMMADVILLATEKIDGRTTTTTTTTWMAMANN